MRATMKQQDILVLGIETSCDESAAAVVARSALPAFNGPGKILSNLVNSQIDHHAPFGGVVPEIAARAHLDVLDTLVQKALVEADVEMGELDGIAVTAGPGLVGGLIVGSMTARAISAVHEKPLLMINHLEGHALTARLTDGVAFPYLLLLVSGGHSQILMVRGVGDYERWATTIDDALGEAFDKTAKMLGFPYPGGPEVERMAKQGSSSAHSFPRPLSGRDTLNMSFSGLKTAVRKAVMQEADSPISKADICASFQTAIGDVLCDRIGRSFERFEKEVGRSSSMIVAGGVASNQYLRGRLEDTCVERCWQWIAPPPQLCTDNAAMIAWAGAERLAFGKLPKNDGVRPRWPLDEAATSVVGKGRKGAKV